MKMKSLFLCLMIGLSQLTVNAQRNCGSTEHLQEQLQQFPKMQERLQEIEKATQRFINDPNKRRIRSFYIQKKNCNTTVVNQRFSPLCGHQTQHVHLSEKT